MTTVLPEELHEDKDLYKAEIGPGSYKTPRLFEGEVYKHSPAFSMGVKYSMKNHYIPPENAVYNYGIEGPGAGKYLGDLKQDTKVPLKIGTGPKCPDSNFHLPTLTPGPVYSNPNYKGIAQSVKARSVFFYKTTKKIKVSNIKGPKRELVFQENITGPVPSSYNYVVPTEFDKFARVKKKSEMQNIQQKLKNVFLKSKPIKKSYGK